MAVGVRTMAEGAHRRRLGRLSAELRAAVPCAAAATTYDHAAADDEHDAVSEQLAAIGPAFAHLGTPVPLGAVGAMRDSSPLLGRAEAGAALRARLDTDGYLLLRGALGRSAVVAARETPSMMDLLSPAYRDGKRQPKTKTDGRARRRAANERD